MFLPTFMTSEHPGSHVFQQTRTIFIHIQDIISTNILTKKNAPPTGGHFHDDRTINMASRVLTRKNDTHPWRPYIIGTNHLTKFHDDWTINVASRVLTRKNAPPPDIIRTNLLTKFHEDRKINVASRVLTRKNAPPPGSHVFQPTDIIFEIIQDIIRMNLLTKFHEDRTINVASRVKKAPPLGSHVFQANTNLLTKIHEDWTINVASREKCPAPWQPIVFQANENCPNPGGHVFSPIWTIIELVRDINETNVLTKFHDDWANIVTSRVFTRFLYSHRNTASPPGGHDWASNVTSTVFTSFKLSRGINGTNVLTKFHEDQAINVASRVFTRQNVDDARRTKGDHKSSP
ncbi:hypothetical protein DPMN_040349 [Dreissena polymorpha]|uniref:Uncharacterized protein n=1 Tax=Dreissena polymorpha TaxID=45954 RepID=A0A9D4CX07_DREPO|nr:hypothetical protein DPMN_040349 [Dreissena polymorpha]